MSTYVISDIHGAYKPYQALKAAVGYDSTKDELYIIGDIFDGNTAHPEDCLNILDDIIADDSITLLLGNHELAHIEYYNACKNGKKKAKEAWRNYLADPLCGGSALLHYFEEHKEKWDYYIGYLINHAVFNKVIVEEEKAFILVHGAPVQVFQGEICVKDIFRYHLASMCNQPTFKEDLYTAGITALMIHSVIKGIPFKEMVKEFEDFTPDDIYCVVGHTPTKYLHKKTKAKFQKVFHKNHIYDIDCGCRANSLNKSYDNSIIASDLCMMRLGKKPTFTYYSKIKER